MARIKVDSDGLPYFDQYTETHWDYTVDWSATMDSVDDTIASSTWSATPTGLTLSSAVDAGARRSIWVAPSANNAGTNYVLVSKIFTAGGRVQRLPIRIKVRDL